MSAFKVRYFMRREVTREWPLNNPALPEKLGLAIWDMRRRRSGMNRWSQESACACSRATQVGSILHAKKEDLPEGLRHAFAKVQQSKR